MYFSWISTTSVLLVIALVLVVRSVRILDRRRHPVVEANAWAGDIIENTDPVFPRDHVLLSQRTEMISNQSPQASSPGIPPEREISDHDLEAGRLAEERGSSRRPGVRVPRAGRVGAHAPERRPSGIRWGRTAFALIGLAAVLLAVILGIAAPFTAVTWAAPVFLLVVGAACLGSLRYLAVQEQTRRGARPRPASAPVDHSESVGTTSEGPSSLVARERGEFFDAQSTSAGAASAGTEASAAETTASAGDAELVEEYDDFADLDVAGLDSEDPATTTATYHVGEGEYSTEAEYVEREDRPRGVPEVHETGLDIEALREQARRVAAGKPVSFTPAGSSWQPVQVPRPTYADAPTSGRTAPEPLEAPEQPRSSSRTLAEADAKGREAARENLDLDDVLSRRRA